MHPAHGVREKWEKNQVIFKLKLSDYYEITFEAAEDGRWLRNGSRRQACTII